jgi:L-lactate permease
MGIRRPDPDLAWYPMAFGFSKIGFWFILVAPVLGWIGVALSGSNTSTNAMFGAFQVSVGKLLGFPALLLPTLNSVGAEVGKPEPARGYADACRLRSYWRDNPA